MSLWHTQRGRRASDTGKFRSRASFGAKKSAGDRHRGWSYHFVSHSTGMSVPRTTYSVTIFDPHQNRVAYLRDYPNLQMAATAAREWIDHRLSRIWPKSLSDIGKIPTAPTPEMPTPEKPTPEKPVQEK